MACDLHPRKPPRAQRTAPRSSYSSLDTDATLESAAGVFGGASYDGLVALEAHAHGRVLLSLDRRAQETYRRLRIAFSGI